MPVRTDSEVGSGQSLQNLKGRHGRVLRTGAALTCSSDQCGLQLNRGWEPFDFKAQNLLSVVQVNKKKRKKKIGFISMSTNLTIKITGRHPEKKKLLLSICENIRPLQRLQRKERIQIFSDPIFQCIIYFTPIIHSMVCNISMWGQGFISGPEMTHLQQKEQMKSRRQEQHSSKGFFSC